MKLYVTVENYEKVKTSFLNLRSFSIINVQEIMDNFGYTYETLDEYSQFIVNDEIRSIMNESISKKKFFNIIYINTELSVDTIENLKDFAKESNKIDKFIFIDDGISHKDLYPLFDEIIFFPKCKRTRIVQCKSIKNPLYYWLNNKPIPTDLLD
jgi:hypothetical protein